jgi:hypothetical protein
MNPNHNLFLLNYEKKEYFSLKSCHLDCLQDPLSPAES